MPSKDFLDTAWKCCDTMWGASRRFCPTCESPNPNKLSKIRPANKPRARKDTIYERYDKAIDIIEELEADKKSLEERIGELEEAAELCQRLKDSQERLAMGVVSEADTIRELTEKIMELDLCV